MSNNELQPGFRLDYLEVYNWGNFDGAVAILAPHGLTALMTGANASGKTTLVDALLTLLVPSQKRFYNQSSGAKSREERTESSYVLGEHGDMRQEDAMDSSKKSHRKKSDNPYSVLLGCFVDSENGNYVTLAQVRWFTASGSLNRAFIVSPHQLKISDHIAPFDQRGEWKKRLKKAFTKTEVYDDNFSQYRADFIERLGMKSEKALTLFNKTVGIKVLGDLNEFVRNEMLDSGEYEDDFNELRAQYRTLLETHDNILKARAQLELLSPVLSVGQQYEESQTHLSQLESVQHTIPYYFSDHELHLLHEAISNKNGELREINEELKQLEKEKNQFLERERTLKNSIDSKEGSAAIRQLDLEIVSAGDNEHQKKQRAESYKSTISRLGWSIPESPEKFAEQRNTVIKELQLIEKQTESQLAEQVSLSVKMSNLEKELTETTVDIESLKGRKSGIPRNNIEIRQGLLQALNLPAEELPFVGELIRVREEEMEWESAIERLMHNFGLNILVQEKYLRAANNYVNLKNLRDKVVYLKVDLSRVQPLRYSGNEEGEFLYDKLDVKKDSKFSEWLEVQLQNQFDYLCTDNEDDFRNSKRGLMKSGLNRKENRHEKDDRPNVLATRNFILGWNNEKKLRELLRIQGEAAREVENLTSQIEVLKQDQKRTTERAGLLNQLKHYGSYNEINWQAERQRINDLEQKRKRLIKESGIDKLEEELQEAVSSRDRTEKKIEKLNRKIGEIEGEIKTYTRETKACEDLLKDTAAETAKGFYELVPSYLANEETASDELVKIRRQRKNTQDKVNELLKQQRKQNQNFNNKLIECMNAFIHPAEKLHIRFPDWLSGLPSFTSKPEYLDDFRKVNTQIELEDLPKHQDKFREYMKESISTHINSFKEKLDEREEDIEEHIRQLNLSLKKIDFNTSPYTYVQLRHKPARGDVRNFKDELRKCIPDISTMELNATDDWMENVFMDIKNLIEGLHQNEVRRKQVLDVRNWLEFSAEELYREENTQRRFFNSSGSLSGGEAAQFTYTVLGAAIAYQFGINHEPGRRSKSFRFIAVDEAFSKLDPEKSHYLMELCDKLQLQLLVITPLDKLHIAEKYISFCHFVSKNKNDKSRVINLTMSEYYENKKHFEQKATEE